MKFFHTHNWKEKERFYTGVRSPFKAEGVNEETILKLGCGVTTILYRCECGACKKLEILGTGGK